MEIQQIWQKMSKLSLLQKIKKSLFVPLYKQEVQCHSDGNKSLSNNNKYFLKINY